jgi:ornithine cyclodeaminase/alanine dehydrogenase-like protein (mu-crystallin family)
MASAMAAVVPPYSGGKLYSTTDGVFRFVIVLFDAGGRLLCTLDGDVITALRTPAVSALAIRALAVPDAATAALIGSGRQAWTHLTMLADELPELDRLAVCARSPGAALELVERARAIGVPAVEAATPAEAVAGCDVVVTVTASRKPLFPASAVSDRALLCAVGATKYDRREIDAETVARCAAVVCDDAIGSRSESGDLIDAAARGAFDWERAIELHDVLAGNVEVPRAGEAPVLFETQGVAIQDVAVAGLAYERHRATGSNHPAAGQPAAAPSPSQPSPSQPSAISSPREGTT